MTDVLITPWLSILIPVYNVADYLIECVQSLIEQCDDGVEIIMLDDRSTDNSFGIMQAIAANSPISIKLAQLSENQGLSQARNSLAAQATGRYLWFIDSDDVVTPNAINELREITAQHSPDLVLCNYSLWRPHAENSTRKRKIETPVTTFAGPADILLSEPIALFSGLYKKGKLQSWSKIFKRSLWTPELRFPAGKYFEDMVFTPRLALKVSTYYYTQNLWIKYRQRSGSILALPNVKKINDLSSGVEGVLALWEAKYPDMSNSAKYTFICYCVKVYLFTLIELKKINLYNQETIEFYRSRLLNNVNCAARKLIWVLLVKGEIGKLLKFLRY